MKKNIHFLNDSKSVLYFFVTALLIAELLTFYSLYLANGNSQMAIFFKSENGIKSLSDSFMDFFNVVKFSSSGDPYHCTYMSLSEKVYPPLSYLLLYPFGRILNYPNYLPTEARDTQFGLISVIVPTMLLCSLMALLLYEMLRGGGSVRILTVISLLLSGISLFAVERGNIIYLAVVCLIYFFMAYQSQNPVKRELACIALAVAAALKIYPAIFGVLLLLHKKYAAAIRTVIYGLAAVFLPFLFFKGGFSNISQMMRNMQAYIAVYTFSGIKRFGFVAFGTFLHLSVGQSAGLLLVGAFLLIMALLTFSNLQKDWKQVMLLTCGLILTPADSAIYCGLYLFIPIVLFLNEQKHPLFDWVYCLLMLWALSPYQVVAGGKLISASFSNLAVISIYFLLLIEASAATARYLSCRKASAVSFKGVKPDRNN